MAVFRDKNDESVLMVDCNCGCCDGLRIKVDKEDGFGLYFMMSYTSGNFYSAYGNSVWRVIKDKIKKIWCILHNKEFYYSEICMTKEQFKEYKDYINSID